MESLVDVAASIHGNEQLALVLGGERWTPAKLGALKGCPLEMLEALSKVVQVKRPELGFSVGDLEALVEASDKFAAMEREALGDRFRASLTADAMVERQARHANNVLKTVMASSSAGRFPKPGKASITKWPTRLQKRLADAGDSVLLRERAEFIERERWLKELKTILDGAGLVACPGTPGLACPGTPGLVELPNRVGKGRRAGTLRKHCKTWNQFARWLQATYGKAWPTDGAEFAQYLEDRAKEPCARTVPVSAYKTLLFMEAAAEIPQWERISSSPTVVNVLEEINLQMESQESRPTKKAKQLLVTQVMAMERVVMDTDANRFIRGYSWYRLFKLWTGMRYADTLGLHMETLRDDQSGVWATLMKTKTTGPGKRILQCKVYISSEAFLAERRWLSTGLEVWKKMGYEAGLTGRDFMLPMPDEALAGFTRRVASYPAAAACSQALFTTLQFDGPDHKVMLMERGIGRLWSEHSERATLRTWAAWARVPDDVKKQMGRWQPSSDEGYERLVKSNVMRAQQIIAEKIRRSHGRPDELDEEVVLQELGELMHGDGFNEEVIATQLELLRYFSEKSEPYVKRQRSSSVGSWEEIGREDRESFVNMIHRLNVDQGEEVEKEPGFEELEDVLQEEDEEEVADLAEAISLRGCYVVSMVGRGSRKTLHKVGECYRLPGVHFKKYEVLGELMPEAGEYHAVCKVCFPKSGGQALVDVERGAGADDDTSGEDISSSDSGSDTSGPNVEGIVS